MKYCNLNKNFYDGFAYQIPFDTPIHWSIVNWIQEDRDNRRWRTGRYVSDNNLHYVELKSEEDLAYFMLRFA
jgi:hypothetical protein